MALTRKMLKAMGIEEEKVEQIIEAHTETVDALKEQRDTYKADAEKLPEVQKQLDTANETLSAAGKDSWKVKYDTLKEEYEGYKTEQTTKESRAAKETAYRALLKEAGISEKMMPGILKVTNLDTMELADGKLIDADKLTEGIKSEWADFVVTAGTRGADVTTPPKGGAEPDYNNMTDAEYYAAKLKKKE
jgi:hypothetical protein